MQCFDECWHLSESIREGLYCQSLNKKLDDGECPKCCDHFKFIESCPNCMYHRTRPYMGETLDGIGYLCTLQDNKEIFQDVRPMGFDYASVPKCPIGKFQKE